MTHLTIDIGNSGCHAAIFEDGVLTASLPPAEASFDGLLRFAADHQPDCGAYACVGRLTSALSDMLVDIGCPLLHVTGNTPATLHNAYATPTTLGADRWAAAVGARALQPQGALLIIDAGTCATFDIVDEADTFRGGNIAPGILMRLRAMHSGTARLPMVSADGPCPAWGDTTETALRAGALRGLQHEAEGYIRFAADTFGRLTVFLCGGTPLQPCTPPGVELRHEPHLVHYGLEKILQNT